MTDRLKVLEGGGGGLCFCSDLPSNRAVVDEQWPGDRALRMKTWTDGPKRSPPKIPRFYF